MGCIKIKSTKTSISFLVTVVVLLSALAVHGAQGAVEITEPNTTIDVDYGDFTNEDQLHIGETYAFTLLNSNLDSTTVRFSYDGLSSNYNATALDAVTLSAGEQRSMTATINVPHGKNSGRAGLGSLVIKDVNNVELDRLSLSQNTLSMLIFDKIKVDYTDSDGKTQSDDFRNSDVNDIKLDKSVKPGTDISFTITYKNRFDSGYDQDKGSISDITLNIDPSDSDLFDDDVTDSVDLSDLDANKKDEYTFSTKVSDSIDADTYDLDFELQGTDGENFDHTFQKTLAIQVKRERDDVRATTSDVSTQLEACSKEIPLNIKLQNFGTRDQKYTSYSVSNTEFGVSYRVDNIILEKFDNDDTYTSQVIVPVTKSLKEGAQSLDLKVFIDHDKLIDQQRIPLSVIKCSTAATTTTTTQSDSGNQNTATSTGTSAGSANGSVAGTTSGTQTKGSSSATTTSGTTGTANVNTQTTSSSPSVIQTVEEPYSTDDFFVGGLIIAIIVVVAMIVVFFILLLR